MDMEDDQHPMDQDAATPNMSWTIFQAQQIAKTGGILRATTNSAGTQTIRKTTAGEANKHKNTKNKVCNNTNIQKYKNTAMQKYKTTKNTKTETRGNVKDRPSSGDAAFNISGHRPHGGWC